MFRLTPKKILDFISQTGNRKQITTSCNLPVSVQDKTLPSSEVEYLVHAKNDPDTFGDAFEKEASDPADLAEEKYLEDKVLPSQKLSTKKYADLIKSFIEKRKIKEAIDVLEVKMIQEDQVKPEGYIYNLILGACGRVGYTKKAFSLYNRMKQRGLRATGGTYTALFNSCANSPWPDDGLQRAKHLCNIMQEKMYEPNVTNYNVMIKAFGHCKDITTAFNLVDEMISKKMRIKDDTINQLLQACIEDKEAGFRHALLVWHKMRVKKIRPSIFTYNLMLRCIRDCGIGSLDIMNDTLGTLLEKGDNKLLFSQEQKLLSQDSTGKEIVPESSTNNVTNVDLNRPNLLAKVPRMGNIISFSEVIKAEDRLLLCGGYKGFLQHMQDNNCTPNIKTFTQLLDSLPGSLSAENDLLKMMKTFNVKPDIDFFNMLIKKRSMRFDYHSAQAVLNDIKERGFKPNLMTFGVLAIGCKSKEEALELLDEMRQHSYRLNTEILGTMLHQACYHRDFHYVLQIMEISLKEDVKPNKIFMQCLADFKKRCKDISNNKENNLSHSLSFQKGFRIFQMRYKTWSEEIQVDDTEDVHPWAQYRATTETDTRHYKDKANRFKAQHISKFRVKTSTKR